MGTPAVNIGVVFGGLAGGSLPARRPGESPRLGNDPRTQYWFS
jgi:hypothetical protein